jgi:NAD-dependent SIR2 family protein deacetylase
MLLSIRKMIQEGVDLCIVIGTSGTVDPAARYATMVKKHGGKIAVVDLDVGAGGWRSASSLFDWVFEGDAAKVSAVNANGRVSVVLTVNVMGRLCRSS